MDDYHLYDPRLKQQPVDPPLQPPRLQIRLERVAEELMGRKKWSTSQSKPTTLGEADGIDKISELQMNENLTGPNSVEDNPTLRKSKGLHSLVSVSGSEEPADFSSEPKNNCCENHSDTSCKNTPEDWKPVDKCCFCAQENLLKLESELVTQIDPTDKTFGSDSDSSDLESDLIPKSLPDQNNGVHSEPSKMTSLESVVAAVATMHGIPAVPGLTSFYPGLWYPFASGLQAGGDGGTQESPSCNNGKTSSGNNDDQSTSINSLEQPLDLSSKSSSGNSFDQKNVFKAKPRMTAITGRRTYTEDELQNALQDILSGKLGTRRAAVLYGIPRSTLRNKVYKLAIEQKREANLSAVAPVLTDLDDDEKDCSGAEEEKEIERTLSTLPSEDILRLASGPDLAAFQKLVKTDDSYSRDSSSETPAVDQPPSMNIKSTTPAFPANVMDPNILLQGLLISGALSGFANNKVMENATLGMLPEFIRNILLHNELLKSSEGGTSKSDTPELGSVSSAGRSGSENNENLEDLRLKIPSFKSGAGGTAMPSSTMAPIGSVLFPNNGDGLNAVPAAGLKSESAHQAHLLGLSSAIENPGNESPATPPVTGIGSVSLRDVIAKSISKTLNPPLPLDLMAKNVSIPQPSNTGALIDQYKWPTISVKKGLGAEVSRFGSLAPAASNMMSTNSNHNSQNNSTGTGGKGTRPKRGKYRNYDRDSLVEAVKAVQRGEMSVHRAGSYYGVPHSTLEYKVKERHLMRPRKREPKPQSIDDLRVTNNSSSGQQMKPQENRSIEKSRLTSAMSGSSKTNSNFDSSPASNGVKGAPFLENSLSTVQMQYSPHMFWASHPHNFPGMSLDFPRTTANSSSAKNVAVNAGSFPTSDSLFATQLRQRFQEHANNSECSGNTSNSSSSANNSKSTTPNSAVANNNNKSPLLAKHVRDSTENLYDAESPNGSFLDGLIRHSLDRNIGDLNHGAFLDHLVKGNLHFGGMGERHSNLKRRSSGPLNIDTQSGVHIKKERSSPLDEASENLEVSPDANRTSEILLMDASLRRNGDDTFNSKTATTVTDNLCKGTKNMSNSSSPAPPDVGEKP